MWIQISSGRGPAECCLAAARFTDFISGVCCRMGLEVQILDSEPGPYKGTYRSVLLAINGSEALEIGMKYDGTLLWISKSPYRVNNQRKNWFFNCEVYEEPIVENLDLSSIKVETMRSSGNGGQNVNKVESAVRVTHQPTGLTATAREERSQALNRKLALARLLKLLKEQELEEQNRFKSELWMQHNRLIRGNPVQVFEGFEFKLRRSLERMNR